MGKVHMLHPSSGRDNFDGVPAQTTNSNNNEEASKAASLNQNTTLTTDKQGVEEKTKNAINVATATQSQTASNNPTN
ncbi:hypothetical protein I4U23_001249 [Adineta vaga]|nr:hypothetical protein I4U23_001249 [Adineta vaga]